MHAGPCSSCGKPIWEGPDCCVGFMKRQREALEYRIEMLEHQRARLLRVLKQQSSNQTAGSRKEAKEIIQFAEDVGWSTEEGRTIRD